MILNLSGGGVGLNFKVVGGTTQPSNPSENTIWINTETEIPQWAIASENPFIAYHDVDLMEDIETADGYPNTSGAIVEPTEATPELYTEEYIPVTYGTVYQWRHTVSAEKSMWLVIVEYTGENEFSKRTVLVNGVSGTEQAGTYTPSSESVTSVRLSWRTFPETTYTIELIQENVAYTVDEAQEGTVWIKNGIISHASFNALKKNVLTVYPKSFTQYESEEWTDKPAMIYQDGAWVDYNAEMWIVQDGESLYDIAGSAVVEQGDGYLNVHGTDYGWYPAYFETQMDLSDYDTLTIEGSFSSGGMTLCVWSDVPKGSGSENRVAQESVASTGATLDVSALTGSYYIGVIAVYYAPNKITNLYLAK